MKVLLFGEVRRILNKDAIELDFEGTINDLEEALIGMFPQIKNTIKNCAFAVNLEYKNRNYHVNNDEEVAIIPPVEGG